MHMGSPQCPQRLHGTCGHLQPSDPVPSPPVLGEPPCIPLLGPHPSLQPNKMPADKERIRLSSLRHFNWGLSETQKLLKAQHGVLRVLSSATQFPPHHWRIIVQTCKTVSDQHGVVDKGWTQTSTQAVEESPPEASSFSGGLRPGDLPKRNGCFSPGHSKPTSFTSFCCFLFIREWVILTMEIKYYFTHIKKCNPLLH